MLESHAHLKYCSKPARVGGQIGTADAIPGRPEFGGNEIGQRYPRGRVMCGQRKLELVPFHGNLIGHFTYRINGQLVHPDDWENCPPNLTGKRAQDATGSLWRDYSSREQSAEIIPATEDRWAVQQSHMVAEERTVKGSYIGSAVPARDIPRYISLYRRGKLPIDKLMGERLTLDGINAGFDRLADGASMRQIIVF